MIHVLYVFIYLYCIIYYHDLIILSIVHLCVEGGEGQDNAAYSQSQVKVTTRQNYVTQKFCFHVKFI